MIISPAAFLCPPAGASSRSSSGSGIGNSATAAAASLGQLLVSFDDSWMEYLDQFAVWKGRDAAGLEGELITMAVKLERSMRRKLKGDATDSARVTSNPDLQVSLKMWPSLSSCVEIVAKDWQGLTFTVPNKSLRKFHGILPMRMVLTDAT
jgi:hypothetical protein